ncbi:hypothetical protein [Plasmodium yoelii yoelii]|uniref:Uncharacterized protein n=1 Tax=Plasmodium yoelii yoelii TaxID=73239 RepID=Q7RR50_PLAYO|nr:hypothetical protein [Plasmodium yoelii yoelii]
MFNIRMHIFILVNTINITIIIFEKYFFILPFHINIDNPFICKNNYMKGNYNSKSNESTIPHYFI